MRLGIIIWSFICSFCLIHTVTFLMDGRADEAILFGGGFMLALYLFIAKTVQYIKEDFPIKIDMKINSNVIDNLAEKLKEKEEQ